MSTPQARSRPKPTLEEVAARAGVSRATASRVLRGASNVSDEARRSVLAATEAIGYSPNRAARSLVTGRTDSIAFVVDETEERMFSDPFFLALLRSAHGAISEEGLQLVFSMISGPKGHDRFVSYAVGGHVDGVILVSLHGRNDLPHRLEEAGVPTVLSGRPLDGRGREWFVDADNVGGARLATTHLLRHGRRVVATITGPQDMCAGQDRFAGYVQALEDAHVPLDPDLVVEGQFTQASGYASMTELLRARPDIDAVFAASDPTALGAMRAIESAGLRIGPDVAVVGFDDLGEAETSHPPLTTVHQPVSDLGAMLARRLIARINGESPPRETILPVELVRRETAS